MSYIIYSAFIWHYFDHLNDNEMKMKHRCPLNLWQFHQFDHFHWPIFDVSQVTTVKYLELHLSSFYEKGLWNQIGIKQKCQADGLHHVTPVLWPLLAAGGVIHNGVARSSPLQSDTHKQMDNPLIWLSQPRFLFIPRFSWDCLNCSLF